MITTMHGAPVKTVKISGKDYVTVAERSKFAHETFGEGGMLGYEVVRREIFSLGNRHFVTVYIIVNHKQYFGTSEIRLDNAPPKSADEKAPMECAETSAVGRALGFAGIGALDNIASADEMVRAGVKPDAQTAPSAPAPVAPKSPAKALTAGDMLKSWCMDNGISGAALAEYATRHGYVLTNAQNQAAVWQGVQHHPDTSAEIGLTQLAMSHEMHLPTLIAAMQNHPELKKAGMTRLWEAYIGNPDDWDAAFESDGIGAGDDPAELAAER